MITKLTVSKALIFTICGALLAGGPDKNIPFVGPGDPILKTDKLHFPRAVYYMRIKDPQGIWQTQGTMTEYGKPERVDGKDLVHRVQVQTFNDGKSYISHTATIEKGSLMPLRTKRESKLPQYQPGFIKAFELTYDKDQLIGSLEKEGEGKSEFPAKSMDGAMFEGDAFGVVLAALPLKKGYQARLPVMYSQMSIPYTVVARVVGQQEFKTQKGEIVKAWAVETDWHDHNSGDVSPGGGSGGTYYVVPNPPKGYPHVPKYINDSFDTEFIPQLSGTR